MIKPGVHIWVWLRDGKNIMKAVLDYNRNLLIFYENDHLILVRNGVPQKQMKNIERTIENKGGKRLNDLQNEPFVFL